MDQLKPLLVEDGAVAEDGLAATGAHLRDRLPRVAGPRSLELVSSCCFQ